VVARPGGDHDDGPYRGLVPRLADADERLQRWISAVVATPGLTAIKDLGEARRVLLDDSLRGLELLRDLDGPIVRIGGPDVPAMGFASNLEHAFMPNADEVAERMLDLARF